MRAIVQRVTSASVTVDEKVISSISRGIVVLLGIGKDDTSTDSDYMANKVLNLRVFDDEDGNWRKSVKDISGHILCVSQFTLLASTLKGNKPDFHRAMGSEQSKGMYEAFLTRMGELYSAERIKDGRFGAMMSVALTNDGPVTFTLDSRKFEYVQTPETSRSQTPKTQGSQQKEV